MSARMKQRAGTSAQWAASTTPLEPNELGCDTDLKRTKRGDAAGSLWPDLAWEPVPHVSVDLHDLAEGGSYTVPYGTSDLINTAGSARYATTLVFPASPIDHQPLMISTTVAIQSLTLSGNGFTIAGEAVIALAPNTGVEFIYTTALGWKRTQHNQLTHNQSSAVFSGYAYGVGGWRWSMPNRSFDYYVHNGTSWLQSTNSGLGSMLTTLEFYAQGTLNVTDTTANYGRYSTCGFHAQIYNPSIAWGAGATNDRPVRVKLFVTSKVYNTTLWSGAPVGNATWLTWQNGPLYLGCTTSDNEPNPGERARFDLAGNWVIAKAPAATSESRSTATSGTVTMPDNTATQILAGSGVIVFELPSTPVDGQYAELALETAYTSITVQATGKTLIGGVALVVTAGSFAKYKYNLARTTWYRVG